MLMSLHREYKWISAGPLVHQHMVNIFTNMEERKINLRQIYLFTGLKWISIFEDFYWPESESEDHAALLICTSKKFQ